MVKEKQAHLGQLLRGYEIYDTAPNPETLMHMGKNGLWLTENNEALLFRLQKSLDSVYNSSHGNLNKPGFYGARVGFANREEALRGAAGNFGTRFTVASLLGAERTAEIIDPRQCNLGALAAATTVNYFGRIPGVTDRVFHDEQSDLQGKTLLTGRTPIQLMVNPGFNKRFIHIPAAQPMPTPIAYHEQ